VPDEGAGVLFIPDEIAFVDSVTDFQEALVEAMTRPIKAGESASIVPPLVMRGPAHSLKHVSFSCFTTGEDPWLELIDGG
jgi:hypothetical protein